ncbi:MAG: DUF2240 family protein [Thermoplasmata archaeon]
MEDLKRTIAILFKRKGRASLTEREFVFSASMDLRWFPPKEAQKLLDLSLKMGLLSLEEGKLRPSFDVEALNNLLDFSPTAEILKEEHDLFHRMVEAIAETSGHLRKEIVSRINVVQAQMGIYVEAAALISGQASGVDMENFYAQVEKLLKQRRPNSAFE